MQRKTIRCLDILSKKGELDRASAKMKKEVEGDLHEIRTTDESWYTRVFENMSGKHDGKAMQSGLLEYLMQRLTPLGEHKRIPMSSMKEEMLALRLLASLEIKVSKTPIKDDRVVGETEYVDGQEKGWEILNSILTVVAQAPFCLYPATGSSQRRPPITIHLLAFFTRTCLTDKFLDKIGLEEFCTEHTSHIISDEEAYAIATHGYSEVKDAHNPNHGHGKTFAQSSQGPCMPCTFRLTREGKRDLAAGLQQSCHFGVIEWQWQAWCLNRLIEGIDEGRLSVVDAILEKDTQGCNAMMHAVSVSSCRYHPGHLVSSTDLPFCYRTSQVNDQASGYAALTIRMLVQAVSFSTSGDPQAKEKAVRRVLNTADDAHFSPPMAAISLRNLNAMEGFLQVGARYWDKKINGKLPRQAKQQHDLTIGKCSRICVSLLHTVLTPLLR